MIPVALTIAGSDPSGGAGIQADLKTFHRLGAYGMSVVTLLTVQNTTGVKAVETMAPGLVLAQLDAVLDDIGPGAAKTGALGGAAIIEALASRAGGFGFPLVVDPVMISKHGAPLLPPDAAAVLKRELLPHAFLVTPNLREAEVLASMAVESVQAMEEAARRIAESGARAVLVKGGHLAGSAVDVLLWQGGILRYESARVDSAHTHGTGCTLSAAVTAMLARGAPLPDAVGVAKRFTTRAIASSPGLGRGCGPVNHHADPGPL